MAKKSKRSTTRSNQLSGAGQYLVDGVMALVRPMVNTEKEWGVERMSELAAAAQEYATSLDDTPNLAGFVSTAADSLQGFADYVNENEFDQILKDSSNYAKRHPMSVIVGGAIAGLVITQMLRSKDTGPQNRGFNNNRKRSKRSKGFRASSSRGNSRRSENSSNVNA